MAEKYAVVTGNWSDPATWDGGVKPVAGDTVHSNNYTVSLDEDATVALITNKSGTTAVAGGKFVVAANNITITSDVEAGATDVMENNFGTFNIVGDLTGGTGSTSNALRTFVGRTTNHVGNATGGNASFSHCHYNDGTLTITGDVYGGSSGSSGGVYSAGNTYVTGRCIGTSQIAFLNQGYAEVSEVTSSSSAVGLSTTGTSIVNTVTLGASNFWPISGNLFFPNDPSLISVNVIQQDLSTVTLTDATSAANYPAENEVESGVVFGNTNQFTGTLQVVDAAQLATDLLDEIQTSSHVVAQRLRAAATDDSVGSIVTSTLGAP